jgi:hypothetical protein
MLAWLTAGLDEAPATEISRFRLSQRTAHGVAGSATASSAAAGEQVATTIVRKIAAIKAHAVKKQLPLPLYTVNMRSCRTPVTSTRAAVRRADVTQVASA